MSVIIMSSNGASLLTPTSIYTSDPNVATPIIEQLDTVPVAQPTTQSTTAQTVEPSLTTSITTPPTSPTPPTPPTWSNNMLLLFLFIIIVFICCLCQCETPRDVMPVSTGTSTGSSTR